MTDFDRNTMIERYMAGRMEASEKKTFLRRVEQDEGLRRALYAETLISRAIRSDRSAVPSQPADSRARFLTMLAVVAPETAIPTTGTGGGTSAAGKLAGMGKFIGGSGAAKVIIAAVIGITATVGMILIVPTLSHTTSTQAVSVTAPAVRQTQTAPAAETGEKTSAPAPAGNQSPSALPVEVQSPRADATREPSAESGRVVTNAEGRKSSPETRSPITSQTRAKERMNASETASASRSKKDNVPMLGESTEVPIHSHPATIRNGK
ncbi:MAG: hypothetical protein JWQ98_446 [Chlorobi bacterium]|nr:hypothetical protein [Chlorobiota bacterium]